MKTKWMMYICTAALLAACGEKDDAPNDDPTEESVSGNELKDGPSGNFEAAATPDLEGSSSAGEAFTYFPGYIEIDRLAGGTSGDFGDANLFAFPGTAAELATCATGFGSDPADATCDTRLPSTALAPCTSYMQTTACACTGDASLDTDTCLEVSFIDWNELLTGGGATADADRLATHRLLDAVKTDGSSFKNGSCVTETKVLGKMDLTAGAVTNNTEYSYLALKRHDNNGDAGYNWIFTEIPPQLDATFDNCSSGDPLVYTLSEGDVMIVGNFNPSSGADLIVRRATPEADSVQLLAQDIVAVDAQTPSGDPVWENIPGSDNLAAVNTTDTAAGVLEVVGGVDQAGNRTDRGAVSGVPGAYNYGPNIFAEAAVDFTVFTSGGSLCEAKFYGSVITQPSSSKTSDLKDLLGPQLFNFGSLSVEASLAESCEKEIVYSVDSLTGPGIDTDDPDSLNGIVCTWTFTHSDGAEKTVNDCSGTLTLDAGDPEGTWTGTLEVQIASGVSCSTTSEVGSVDVYEPIEVDAGTEPACGLGFDYSGSVTGGSPALTQEWRFSGPGTVDPATSTTGSGSVNVGEAGTYAATLTASDVRDTISCSGSANSSEDVADSLSITPTLTPSCDLNFDYAVEIEGGLGSPTIDWQFSGPGTANPASSSSASGTVNVDGDGTYTGTVTVSEQRGDKTCEVSNSATVDAFAAIDPSLRLDESCSLGFDYSGSATGGSGSLSYAWEFTGPGDVTPATASGTSGAAGVGKSGTYTATLTVTDDRTDVSCSAETSGTVDAYTPLSVTKADLTPTCERAFGYSGAYTGGSPNAKVQWTFSGPGAVSPPSDTALDGSATVGADGSYSGTLTITDERNGLNCTATGSDTVAAYAPLAADVATTDRCDSTFDYAATGLTGGSGSVSYEWTLSGPGSVSATTTTGPSGNATVGEADQDYTALLTVTDNRSDITCTTSGSDTAHPLAPIEVSISPNSESNTCSDANFADSVIYTATVSGGDGVYTYNWSGCTSTVAGACTVNPDDDDFCAASTVQVTVDDGAAICDPAPSEQETYEKRTVISASDN